MNRLLAFAVAVDASTGRAVVVGDQSQRGSAFTRR
jgi:hypothetical protein